MGSSLCCHRPSTPRPQPKQAEQLSGSHTSTIDHHLIKPADYYSSMTIKVEKEHSTTLRECLLASPGPCQSINGTAEIHINIRQLPKKMYPTSPELPADQFFTPKTSFFSPEDGLSSGKLGRIDEEDNSVTSASRSSQSGKVSKRVSFNEGADIIIFYTPEDTFTED